MIIKQVSGDESLLDIGKGGRIDLALIRNPLKES